MFSSAVRTTLTACRGYECQEKDGIFMLAFSDTSERLPSRARPPHAARPGGAPQPLRAPPRLDRY
jgi:hypothetical protein